MERAAGAQLPIVEDAGRQDRLAEVDRDVGVDGDAGRPVVPGVGSGDRGCLTSAATSVKRFALWRPQLDAPGQYRILAKVPAKASTRRAVYQVRTTSGWVKRVRNQLKNRGKWVNLGVHTLAARPVVRLTDRTGEAGRSGRRVAFDAVKFVPVGSFVGPSTAGAT